jgi:ElaA protein
MEVRRARDEAEIGAALDLRRRVFCGEQGISPAAEHDGLDGEALHVVAFEDERLVGTCRLVFADGVAHLARMAVEPDRRRVGIGAALLAAAECEACAVGATSVRLHAQTAARRLYDAADYSPVGDELLEEGIPHIAMQKALA